jgi:hypothetical protein
MRAKKSPELDALQSGHSSRVHAPSYRSMPRETVDPLKAHMAIMTNNPSNIASVFFLRR